MLYDQARQSIGKEHKIISFRLSIPKQENESSRTSKKNNLLEIRQALVLQYHSLTL